MMDPRRLGELQRQMPWQWRTLQARAAGDDRVDDCYVVAQARWADLLREGPSQAAIEIESGELSRQLDVALAGDPGQDLAAGLERAQRELEELAGEALGGEIVAAAGILFLLDLPSPPTPRERAEALLARLAGRSCSEAVQSTVDTIAGFFGIGAA